MSSTPNPTPTSPRAPLAEVVMLDDRQVLVQLVTRIPKRLHRRLRVHCVSAGTTVMAFTAEAICAELARIPRDRNRRRRVPVG